MNELIIRNEPNALDFDTLQRMALALFESGYFPDVRSKAQAIVKVMAGNELGIPPFASMAGINIIKGKPVLGANLIATLVDQHPRYDFFVTTPDGEEVNHCIIRWVRDGKEVGKSTFTIHEAIDIGLADKTNWKNYPSDMLFARAISRGVKRYAPGVFAGAPVYTADEMGVDIDPEGYIEGEAVEVQEPESKPEKPVKTENKPVSEAEVVPDPKSPGKDETPESDPVEPEGKESNGRIIPSDDIEPIGALNGDQESKDEPEPEFDETESKIEEIREWLEVLGQTTLGVIADAAVRTGLYYDREEVRATLLLDEERFHEIQKLAKWTEDNPPDFRRRIKDSSRVFNPLMERKGY